MRAHLLKSEALTAAELDSIEADARARIEEAVEFAEQGPLPEPWEITTDVYVTRTRGDAL